ncbi:MAG: hypothetical protein JWM48_317 [Mycobacterium sp.]|nr:hypothetical protein [Mycobacterium sp.]
MRASRADGERERVDSSARQENRCAAAVARPVPGLAAAEGLADAARRAVASALADWAGPPPDLLVALVATGPGFDGRPAATAALLAAAEAAGTGHSVGCSVEGVLAATGGGAGAAVLGAPGVAVWCARLPGARLRSFHLEVVPTPQGLAVTGLPEFAPDAVPAAATALLLADPTTFPTTTWLRSLATALPDLSVVGAVAAPEPEALRLADPGEPSRAGADGGALLLSDGRVFERGAVGTTIEGLAGLRGAVAPGCRPVGPVLTVTAAEGSALLELAGQPAAAVLRRIVAELPPEDAARAGAGLHLGLARDEYATEPTAADWLVRPLLGTEARREALVVGDVLEVGSTVQFQLADRDVADAGLAAALGGGGGAAGALLLAAAGRGRAGTPGTDRDAELAVRVFGPRAAVGGGYTGGQIGPGPAGRGADLFGLAAGLLVVPR